MFRPAPVNLGPRSISGVGPFGAHSRVWGDGSQMVPDDPFNYFGFAGTRYQRVILRISEID